ncbi:MULTISPECIES: FxLYD domain-containing protein [Pseudomonas]|uniref:FxLYD domain-containing protein n=1 Tax=Pseudomonas TaxID=286 RepID=UPI00117BA258|nr:MULTISPECIES: FxLYD domain-containing protein [Pseudomonas]
MRKILALAALFLSTAASADWRVEVSDLHTGKAPAGYPAVMGLARNTTNGTLSNVFVKFKLYDEDGNIVGNTMAAGQDIGPGETWKFAAPTTVPFNEAKLGEVDVK